MNLLASVNECQYSISFIKIITLYYKLNASCTKGTLGQNCLMQHCSSYVHTKSILSHDHLNKGYTSEGCWSGLVADTNCFFQIRYIALVTASSLHAISITLTTFSLAPNSFHSSTLLLINLSILSLSLCYIYSHLITNGYLFHLSIKPYAPWLSSLLTHVNFQPNSQLCYPSQPVHHPPIPLIIYSYTLSFAFRPSINVPCSHFDPPLHCRVQCICANLRIILHLN